MKCEIKIDHHRENIALRGREGAPKTEEIHVDSGTEKNPVQ